MKVSGITMRPPFGSRACVDTTASRADVSRTGAAIASTASDAAAALNELRKLSMDGIVAGLNSNAAGLQRDQFLRKTSRRLRVSGWRPAIVAPQVVAFRPSELQESLAERRYEGLSFHVALGIPHQH